MSKEYTTKRSNVSAEKGIFFSLRSKMLIYFGLLVVLTIAALKWMELYGIPLTSFGGEYKTWQSEEFKQLSLVADLKKERLLHWIDERKGDTKAVADNMLLGSQVALLHSIIQEHIDSGMDDEELWMMTQNERTYQSVVQFLDLIRTAYYGRYEHIRIADAETGIIMVATRSIDLGHNVSEESFFTEALRFDGSCVNIGKCPQTGKIELSISQVIKVAGLDSSSADRNHAVVMMHIDPSDFIIPMLHTGEALGETGEALLVNQKMKILTSLKHPLPDGSEAQLMEHQINTKPAGFAVAGKEGIVATQDYRGIPVLAAYRHIIISPERRWGMVIKQDQAEVFAPLRRSLFYSLMVGIVGVVAVLCLVYVIASRLSRPLRTLSQTAHQIGSGDLSARAPVTRSTTDEVGVLTTAFNSMAQRVQIWDQQAQNRTAQLSKLNAELSKEIDERRKAEQESERLNRELISKNNELEQIVYVASHDLRSPLVNIQGFSKELKYSIEQLDSLISTVDVPLSSKEELAIIMQEDIPEALQYIAASGTKMDSLLSGLLRISRLGRVTLTIKELDMNELILAVSEAFEFQIRETKVDLQIDELPPCSGDAEQIDQLFANLLDNAIKYLAPDRTGSISISGQREGDDVVYCVADNGIGIAVEHQSNIFEIFHRLDPTIGSGEGLGLAIARRIVDRYNGRIWLESERGKGSKFFVSLPSFSTR